jgi:hypothetical protein
VPLRQCGGRGLKGGNVGFASADANSLVDGEGEDLAVTDLPGLGSACDGFDDLFRLIVGRDDLDFELRHEAHGMSDAA